MPEASRAARPGWAQSASRRIMLAHTHMSFLRRTRGTLLRVVRRRMLSVSVGLALAVPSAWIQWGWTDAPWWMQGVSLIVGATGLAFTWTGLTGASPDWVE